MVLLAAAGTSCSSESPTRTPSTAVGTSTGDPAATDSTSGHSASTEPSTPPEPVTIAFAGDVHFEGRLQDRLADPATAMGPMASILASADIAIANLETAITTRGEPQPKEFTFRSPPTAMTALLDSGVDVVTMANNHGLDYGPFSVPDALAASADTGLPIIGIGENAEQAYAPWIVTVRGQRIAFLAATAVLDSNLISSWSATADQAGIATALDGNNEALVAAVEAVRPLVDTVIVDMHYGSDLQTCPTEIQQGVVEDVVRAGADVVVGQHAHVVLGGGYDGSAYVHYGLGNFQFYVSGGGPTAQTGVLLLTVTGRTVTDPRWVPGQIVGGLPTELTGSAAEEAQATWQSLRSCAGLTETAS
jgi:poly-gamma-glutamate capsule biosynthesis protein CapA/YwtB (metallophosphatase superfamily)